MDYRASTGQTSIRESSPIEFTSNLYEIKTRLNTLRHRVAYIIEVLHRKNESLLSVASEGPVKLSTIDTIIGDGPLVALLNDEIRQFENIVDKLEQTTSVTFTI